MKRRVFFQTGLAAGALSVVGGRSMPLAGLPIDMSPRAGGPIRLNANENPLGLAPAARRAVVQHIVDGNRYPFTVRQPLIEAIAKHHEVESDNIVLGTGSTEVLQMAVQAMGQHKARFIIADPTFEDVSDYMIPWDLELIKIPLRADYAHDMEAMRAAAEASDGLTVVYLCNPNNPTGTLTPSVEIDAWIRSASDQVQFLVDEAYFEYAEKATEYWSALKWIETNPNVMVVRTFSKIYGMAGMRLGYGIAHKDTAEKLRSLQSQNNANILALAAAIASLEDKELVPRSLAENDRAKRVLLGVLDDLGLDHLPSYTNFVMHRINGDLKTHIERMRDMGIGVGRPFPPMLDYNRVSIGSVADMETFAGVLGTFRERGWV